MKTKRDQKTRFAASLPNAIAYCELVRALRTQHRFNRLKIGLLILRLPGPGFDNAFRSAAEHFVDRDEPACDRWSKKTSVVVVGGRRAEHWPETVGEWFDGCNRVLALCEQDLEIPVEIGLAADAVLELAPPSVQGVVGGWRMGRRGPISDSDAEQIRRVPFKLLEAVARPGRSVADVVDRIIEAASGLKDTPEASSSKNSASRQPVLEDLVGLGEAEEWGRELAQDLIDWKSGRITWDCVDRGILLSGPPGCGKTTFAKALANSCGVPLVAGSLAQWQAAGYLNALLKSMRAAFEEAKKNAPSILFIDEVDAFGDRAKFSGHNDQYCTEVISGLLECLDGVAGREGVVVVGAANYPQRLDPAITRSGRLDRHVSVSLPDENARVEILDRLLERCIDQEKLREVARRLSERSGADLERLVRETRRRARRASRTPLIEDLEASLPARNELSRDYRWRVAVHETGHAVVGLSLGYATIRRVRVPRWQDANGEETENGQVEFIHDHPVFRTLARVEIEIATLLAGMAAEMIVLGDRSAGAGGVIGSDLQRATALATAAFRSWGLGERIRFMDQASESTASLAFDTTAAQWVDSLLTRCFQKASELLDQRGPVVKKLANQLIESDELSGDRIETILRQTKNAKDKTDRAA